MNNPMLVTGYFRAAYIIAAAVYVLYIVSLSVRARRATRRESGSTGT